MSTPRPRRTGAVPWRTGPGVRAGTALVLGRLTGRLRGRQRDRGVVAEYDPHPGARPDPGEIVWTWVPYEDDPRQGKDRPVLLIAREGSTLLGLSLTSKDHDRDAAQEARAGRYWFDIGTGSWDATQRPSEVRLDRVLPVDPATVRRVGATLDRARFDAVIAARRVLE